MFGPECFQSTGTKTARHDKYEINRRKLLKEKRKELTDGFMRVREKHKINPVYGSIIKEYADYCDIERTQKQQQYNTGKLYGYKNKLPKVAPFASGKWSRYEA